MHVFRYPIDDSAARTRFFLLTALVALVAISGVAMGSGWYPFVIVPLCLVMMATQFADWRRVARGHLAGDRKGVTLEDETGRHFYRWGPESNVVYHPEVTPGVVRLVNVYVGADEVPQTVTVPWHRFRVTSEALVFDLRLTRTSVP